MAEEIKIESAEVNAPADENLKKFFAELQSNEEVKKYFADAIEGLDKDAAIAKISEILKSAGHISDDAAAPSAKMELDEESMESVSGGIIPFLVGAAAIVGKAYSAYQIVDTVYQIAKAGKEIYDTYQAEKQKAEEAAFMSGGINVTGNFNNDNRGGKQMSVQMGDNLNSSSGNSM